MVRLRPCLHGHRRDVYHPGPADPHAVLGKVLPGTGAWLFSEGTRDSPGAAMPAYPFILSAAARSAPHLPTGVGS
jgi:hypothetical protein